MLRRAGRADLPREHRARHRAGRVPAAAGKRETSRHRHVPALRQRIFHPRRRPNALRQGRPVQRCAEDVRRHGRRAGRVFPHDVRKRGLRRRVPPEQVGRRLLHGVSEVPSAVHPRKLQRHVRRRGRRDARGRPRAQRLPDRGQPLRARARLRRHGNRRNALDEHGVFRLAVSRRLLPEGGRRGALPLPARARCAQLPALRHDGGRIPAPRLCRARPHPGRAQRRLAGAGGEIPPVYRPERHPVSRARHPLAVPDAHLRDAVLLHRLLPGADGGVPVPARVAGRL